MNKILDELNILDETSTASQVEQKLELIRSRLLSGKQIRFYLCTDLNKLVTTSGLSQLDRVWLEHFSPSMSNDERGVVFASQSATPFSVVRTSSMKRSAASSCNNKLAVHSPEPRRDFIVGLGSTESAYLKSIASCNIDSHKNEKYAALLVLIEYFCQTEVRNFYKIL